MRTGVTISVSAADRRRLEAIVADRNTVQKHAWRARIVLLTRDPAFAEKLHAIVGLYVSPPAHAVVLSVDEKSQIQALDRTQPGLPLKKGRGATMTHDYKRNGTTTLFAALNVLDGTVFGTNMQRHRHQEFIRFLNALEREIPAGASSALDLPLHPDVKLMAECRRGLLRQTLPPATEARRVLLRH